MQEGMIDYYNEGEGCCLNCYDAHQGCLCYQCKCKKCFWYSSLYDGSGECDKKYELIEERKKKWLRELKLENKKDNKLFEYKKKYNEEKLANLERMNTILNRYSCQKCGFEFVDEDDLKIEKDKFPLCLVCNGEIKLTNEEVKILKEDVEREVENEKEKKNLL